MKPFLDRRRAVDLLLLVPALYLAALVLYTMAGRWDHPFDLEWMEGGMLAHAWRIQEWVPVYMEPDETWIPYIYPPGYPAVVAALGSVFGLSMGLGRAVSVASTLAASGALVAFGVKLKNPVAGLLAACIYLICYPSSGAFYDLVRPDALALAFFSWSVLLGLGGARMRYGAALLLAAAFMVKQNYAAYGVAMALGIWAQHGWREGLKFGLVSAVPALAYVGALQVGTGGHFLTTVLEIAGAHPMVHTRFFPGGVEELGRHLGPVLGAVALGLTAVTALRNRWVWAAAAVGAVLTLSIGLQVEGAKNMRDPWWVVEWGAWLALGAAAGAVLTGLFASWQERELDGRWVYGVGIALTAFFTGGLMRAHHGGFLNVWMPVHWVLALSLLVVLAAMRARFERWYEIGLLPLVALQLYVYSDFDPQRFRPQPADLEAGQQFVELLEECEGPVLSPHAVWLPTYAGHPPSWHLIALWDIGHRDGPYRDGVVRVRQAVRDHRWSCIVDGSRQGFGYGINENYELWRQPRVRRPADWVGPPPLMPKTGWRVRPQRILVPDVD